MARYLIVSTKTVEINQIESGKDFVHRECAVPSS